MWSKYSPIALRSAMLRRHHEHNSVVASAHPPFRFCRLQSPIYQIGACGTGRKSSAKVLAAWLHAKKPEFYWGRQKQCEPSQSHHWAPPATIVCSEDESGGRMFLGDVAAGNSCFGRAAQEIREKAKGSAYSEPSFY